MKYRVYWTRTAVRDLKKLDKRIAERILNAVEEAAQNPFRYFKKLRAAPLHSLRVRSYRIIAMIDRGRLTVIVLVVEHRRRAYKKVR